jgi:hypothetical protein
MTTEIYTKKNALTRPHRATKAFLLRSREMAGDICGMRGEYLWGKTEIVE